MHMNRAAHDFFICACELWGCLRFWVLHHSHSTGQRCICHRHTGEISTRKQLTIAHGSYNNAPSWIHITCAGPWEFTGFSCRSLVGMESSLPVLLLLLQSCGIVLCLRISMSMARFCLKPVKSESFHLRSLVLHIL